MYCEFFGLKDKPFSITPDPRYLYLSPQHREALAHLLYGVTEGSGFVVLSGEVGTGKTTVSRCLVEQMPENVDLALVLNPSLTPVELLASTCDELRVALPPPPHSLKTLTDVLNAYLLAAHAGGRRTVLLIDEAQNLSVEVLEEIRLLTNLETATQKLLQIILVGQPELNRVLTSPSLRQLNQRVAARFHLRPLTRGETAAYIRHRLAVCGRREPLFSHDALRVLHRASGGVPRLLNILCDRALLGAYASDRRRIGVTITRRAAAEVLASGQHAGHRTIALATVLVLAVAALLSQRPLPWTPRPVEPSPASVAHGDAALPGVELARAASAQAPAAAQVATLESLLAAARQQPGSAASALLALWGVATQRPGGYDPVSCTDIESLGLACLDDRGTWNSLRQYDRPALLRLGPPGGERHSVALVALNGDVATLGAGQLRRQATIAEVDPYWLGDFVVPWRPPAFGLKVLRVGARGDAVLWLRTVLGKAMNGEVLAGTDPVAFDHALEAQVRSFQSHAGLSPDGVVGARTLLHLTELADTGDGPHLVTPNP